MIAQKDRALRTELQGTTRMVAQTINPERIKALTGTAADLENTSYTRLKEQLSAIRAAQSQCRFIYLLGRKADGSIFFFGDSEPADSKDCSPPGQLFAEAPEGIRLAFTNRTAACLGPVTDRWGTWVTGLEPILDTPMATGKFATAEDAQGMAQKAVAFYRQYGRERFLQAVNNPQGDFCKGELYVFVYDQDMTMRAHPTKPELVGQNLLDKKDWAGGKPFRREIQSVARSQGKGWVDYEYENPARQVIEPKTTYVESVDDLIVCAGAYKGTGTMIAALGLDIDARAWNGKLLRAALPAGLCTLVLVGLLWLGWALQGRRTRAVGVQSWWLRWLEPGLVAAVGVSLSLLWAWTAHMSETRDRAQAFAQLMASRTERIAEHLYSVRDTELEALAAFYESSETVSPEEFRAFTDHLLRNPAVSAWEWLPAVPEADRARFEAQTRAEGLTGFAIWQRDPQRLRIPATPRPVHYPVVRVAPPSNNSLLGYDPSSTALSLAALEEAAHTGLTTASEAADKVEGTGTQKWMAIHRPVFAKHDPKHLRGFVVAVLQLEALLQAEATDSSGFLEIELLHQAAAPQRLATSWGTDSPQISGQLAATRPILAFGKAFSITGHAGRAFLKIHPKRAGGLALLVGLGLTATLATIAALVLHRHQDLEHLVQQRTHALRESEKSYRNQFAANTAMMLLIDPEGGAILDANAAAAAFYGYPRERLLAMRIFDINTVLPTSVILQEMGSVAQEQGRRFEFQHRLADGSLRHVEVSSSAIQFDGRVVLHSIIQDITTRKQAEARLSALANRLSLATRAGGVGIWDYDTVHNVLVWDAQMYRIYGIREDQFGGAYEAWQRGLHPEDRVRGDAEIQSALSGKKDFDTEFRVVWPDDSIHFVRGNAMVERDASGRPLRMIGTNWDITPQKRTEEALRASETVQRQLMNNLPAGVVIIDPVTRVIELVNGYAATLFGAPVSHLVGQRCHALLCPINEGACPICDLGQVMDASDRVMLKADGSLLPILKTVKQIQLNGQEKMLECFVDITDQKRLEEKLKSSEANFRTFFATMADMIIVGSPEGGIFFSNAAVTQTLGYSPDELATMHILDLHPAGLRREASDIFAAMFRGERESCPLPLARKDGELIPVETRIWFGQWDGADCIFGISKNLTAEQEAQQRFERLFRNNPALMALASLPGREFTDVNEAFLKSLGYSRNDIIGRTTQELGLFVHPEQQAALAAKLQAEGRIVDFELQIRRRDGAILDGLFSGEVITTQGQRFFLTVMIDIGTRQRL